MPGVVSFASKSKETVGGKAKWNLVSKVRSSLKLETAASSLPFVIVLSTYEQQGGHGQRPVVLNKLTFDSWDNAVMLRAFF